MSLEWVSKDQVLHEIGIWAAANLTCDLCGADNLLLVLEVCPITPESCIHICKGCVDKATEEAKQRGLFS